MVLDIESFKKRHMNPMNKLITKDHINKIFVKFGINDEVGDIDIYRQAFVYKNYVNPSEEQLSNELPLRQEEKKFNVKDCVPFADKSYDQMEFMGDRILEMIICHYIYTRYPNQNEQFMTDLKIKLVQGTRLNIFAKKLKLNRYILLSRQCDHKFRNKADINEDVFEAFLAAIFIDFKTRYNIGNAYEICDKFICNLLERYINFSHLIVKTDNYKNLLMNYYHANFKGANPEYVNISTTGPPYDKTFKAGVKNIDGHIIATGEGDKLINAEQIAAKEALKYYNETIYSDNDEPNKEIWNDPDSESL